MKLPQKTIFWYLIFLLLGFLILFFNQLGGLGWFYRLTQPILTSLYSSTNQLKDNFNFLGEANRFCPDQSGRVSELEEEVARLTGELTQLEACQEEVKASRRLLGAPLPAEWQFLPVKLFKVEDSFFVDQGKKMGITTGMPLVYDNVYLGKVIEVQEQVSKVELIYQEGSKVAVRIKSDEGIQAKGLLNGLGRIEAEVDQILTQEIVKKGDVVVTAGDETIPPDLALGKVESVIKEKNEIYQKAKVRLLINPEQLTLVFLIIDR